MSFLILQVTEYGYLCQVEDQQLQEFVKIDNFHLCLYSSLSPQLQIFCRWFLFIWLQQKLKLVWRLEFKFLNLTVQSLLMNKYHPLHLYIRIPAAEENDLQSRQLVQHALYSSSRMETARRWSAHSSLEETFMRQCNSTVLLNRREVL